jgi:hypothetical protein
VPWAALNFAGPKVWAAPLKWAAVTQVMGGEMYPQALPVWSLLAINAVGVWLIASPGSSQSLPGMWLRRALRYYPGAAVVVLAVLVMPWFAAPVPLPYQYQLLAVVALIELPGTAMLYAHLARLAHQLREPELERRGRLLIVHAAAMQVLALPVLAHLVEMTGPFLASCSLLYGLIGLAVGLRGLDFFLDLYRALADAADRPLH